MSFYQPSLKIWLLVLTFNQVSCECCYDQPCTTKVRPHGGRASVPTPSPSSPSPPSRVGKSRPMNISGMVNSTAGSPLFSSLGASTSGLQVGFYVGKCIDKKLDVESIIASEVESRFKVDPTLLPGVLRLQFHDCFVRGCDASILLEGNSTEKTASPNRSVRGYKLVEALKQAVEVQCPGVVSCADVIAIATKVLIKLGGGPDYPVQTGRRDGLVSQAEDVQDLPGPFLSVDDTIAAFAAKNFTTAEMVVLLGCHTVGIAHCRFIKDRLYPGTSLFDPLMDPNLRSQLIAKCPLNTLSSNFTFLDQGARSSNTVDNSYFSQIMNQRGVLPIDQELARHPETQGFVRQLSLNATLFKIELGNAMIKLQALDILTGVQGEVRKVCTRIN